MSQPVLSVLLIEDNQQEIKELIDLIQNSKHNLTVVHSIKELDKAILKGIHDIIITGLQYQNFSCEDVLELINKQDYNIPVVVLLNSYSAENVEEIIQKGASGSFLWSNLEDLLNELPDIANKSALTDSSREPQLSLDQPTKILHTLMDSIEDFIFLKDTNGRYLKVNKSMASHLGIQEEYFVGRTDEELMIDYAKELSVYKDIEAFQNQRYVKFETEYKDNEGNRLVLETVKSPIKVGNELGGLVGVSRNITDKKIIEEQLSRNQMILNQAEIITNSASFHYNPDTDILTTSNNFKNLLDISQDSDKLSLHRFTRFVHPNVRSLFNQEITKAIKLHEVFEMEFQYLGTNSADCFAKLVMRPDLSESPPTFYGTIVDITAQRRNFKALDNVQEKERIALARELHDNIGQKLSVAKMYLDHAKDNGASNEIFQKIYQLIHQTIQDTRVVSRELSTKLVAENGLKDALNQLMKLLPKTIEVEIQMEFHDDNVHDEIGGNIFRIVQEAINNTMKYANASKFSVQINEYEEYLLINLSDDGVGFDLQEKLKHASGLNNIEQRVKSCNGIIQFHSKIGHGTSITAKIPPHQHKSK